MGGMFDETSSLSNANKIYIRCEWTGERAFDAEYRVLTTTRDARTGLLDDTWIGACMSPPTLPYPPPLPSSPPSPPSPPAPPFLPPLPPPVWDPNYETLLAQHAPESTNYTANYLIFGGNWTSEQFMSLSPFERFYFTFFLEVPIFLLTWSIFIAIILSCCYACCACSKLRKNKQTGLTLTNVTPRMRHFSVVASRGKHKAIKDKDEDEDEEEEEEEEDEGGEDAVDAVDADADVDTDVGQEDDGGTGAEAAVDAEKSTCTHSGSLLETWIGKEVVEAGERLGMGSAEQMVLQVILALPPVRLFPCCQKLGNYFLIFEIAISLVADTLLRIISATLATWLKLFSFVFDLILVVRATSFTGISINIPTIIAAFKFTTFSFAWLDGLYDFFVGLLGGLFDVSIEFSGDYQRCPALCPGPACPAPPSPRLASPRPQVPHHSSL